MTSPRDNASGPLDSLLDAMAGVRVAVLGDFFLDEYVAGSVQGLSPEMPVPRLVRESVTTRPGAAGNLAANFAALGARVDCLGAVGDDTAGERLRADLAALGLDVEGLVTEPGRETTTVTRFASSGPRGAHHHLRLDSGGREPLSESSLGALRDAIAQRLRETALVFVADYDESGGPGVVTPALLRCVREAAAKSGARVFGTSRERGAMLDGIDVLVANECEVEALGLSAASPASSALQRLEEVGIGAVCMTRGPRGARWLDESGWQSIEPRPSVEVDPCGAGDSFAATLSLALATGAELAVAGQLAAAAGGLAVEREGTEAIGSQDLREADSPSPESISAVAVSSAAARKFRTLHALAGELETSRRGHRIVFTNGCFDVFHPGHIHFLREARALGDRLVVALNSDRSTAANKGPGRPVIPEGERVEILAGLDAVDFVTFFDELTPVNAIALLRPDVLVKGGNYSLDEVVGRGLVEEYGGRVAIVPHSGSFDTEAFMAAVSKASDGRRE